MPAQRNDQDQRQRQADKQQGRAGGLGCRRLHRAELQRRGRRRVFLLRLFGAFEGVVDQAHTLNVSFEFPDGQADHAEIDPPGLLDEAGQQRLVANAR